MYQDKISLETNTSTIVVRSKVDTSLTLVMIKDCIKILC
jgi:hypothetical protein